jgi:hypothetical protein
MAEERSQTRERWNFQAPNMLMLNRVLELATDPTKLDAIEQGLLFWWKALKPYHKGTNQQGTHYDCTKDWEKTLNGGHPTREMIADQLGVISDLLDHKGILLEQFLAEGPNE